MGFFRQEYWNGLPFPSSEDIPDQGSNPRLLQVSYFAGRFFTTVPPEKPKYKHTDKFKVNAWGWCTGMTQRDSMGREEGGGRREEGSGWGTHVYLWQFHFDIWQNQYNIVKLNKIKFKKEKKKNEKSYTMQIISIIKQLCLYWYQSRLKDKEYHCR